MSRSKGAVWETSRVPTGPLQFRIAVVGGYDARWYFLDNVIPSDWTAGVTYDSGVKINDIQADGCSSCDDATWK